MKKKTLALLGLAVCCGLLAAFMTSRLLSQRNAPPPDEDDKVMVLVAKQNLPYGTRLDVPDNYFEQKPYSIDQVPSGALREFKDAQSKLVMVNLVAQGTTVTKDQLMDAEQGGLPTQITAGKCAIGIQTNAVNTAGGLIIPNCRVDVVLTTADEAQVVLSDVLVRAINTSRKVDPQAPVIPSTVTLEVDWDQAVMLNVARKQGELSLVVRALGDHQDTTGMSVKKQELGKKTFVSSTKSTDGNPAALALTQPKPLTFDTSKPDSSKGEDETPVVKKKKAFMQELFNGSERIAIYFDDQTGRKLLDTELDQYDLPKSGK
jgi:pilus assembly protein CpaB